MRGGRLLGSGSEYEFSVKAKTNQESTLQVIFDLKTTINRDKPDDFSSQEATRDVRLGKSDKNNSPFVIFTAYCMTPL